MGGLFKRLVYHECAYICVYLKSIRFIERRKISYYTLLVYPKVVGVAFHRIIAYDEYGHINDDTK